MNINKVVAKLFGGRWVDDDIEYYYVGFVVKFVWWPIKRFVDRDCLLFLLRIRIKLLEFKIWIKNGNR